MAGQSVVIDGRVVVKECLAVSATSNVGAVEIVQIRMEGKWIRMSW
jgi:hypothetical protein